jgi:hypothetical protein
VTGLFFENGNAAATPRFLFVPGRTTLLPVIAGRRVARMRASREAIQNAATEEWIASSLTLLATTRSTIDERGGDRDFASDQHFVPSD